MLLLKASQTGLDCSTWLLGQGAPHDPLGSTTNPLVSQLNLISVLLLTFQDVRHCLHPPLATLYIVGSTFLVLSVIFIFLHKCGCGTFSKLNTVSVPRHEENIFHL